MVPFTRLVIPDAVLRAMIEHARAELPIECCGLLAGRIEGQTGVVTQRFAVRNDLASPTDYASNPHDLLAAARATRAAGTEFLAIYHSHPRSDPVPSRKDLERNYWGDTVVHVIIGLAGDTPDVRAWWLTETAVSPAQLEVV
jgi:proteasome lid subunit RPN8/RPN11